MGTSDPHMLLLTHMQTQTHTQAGTRKHKWVSRELHTGCIIKTGELYGVECRRVCKTRARPDGAEPLAAPLGTGAWVPGRLLPEGLIARPWPDPCKLPQASAAAVPSLRSTGASCPQSPASCHCPATAARAPHSRHRRGAGCPLIRHPERPPVRPALSSLGLAAVVVSARPCPCPYPYPSCACSSSWWSCLPPGGHGAVKGKAKRPSSLHLHPRHGPRSTSLSFFFLLLFSSLAGAWPSLSAQKKLSQASAVPWPYMIPRTQGPVLMLPSSLLSLRPDASSPSPKRSELFCSRNAGVLGGGWARPLSSRCSSSDISEGSSRTGNSP